jgi:hypothetical protein
MEEYLPIEEIQTLKQVSYLIMMTLFMIDTLYQILFYGNDLTLFAIFDIMICILAIILIKVDDIKSALIVFSLMPFVSFDFLILDSKHELMLILSLIHFVVLIYMIFYYYDKFKKYTKSNGLSYAILLLFGIIFVSFFWTAFVENVNLLDALVMVSNAFTSNGYAILGHSIPGKINGLFLVWSGYVLSGVGTATLTVALLTRQFTRKFDELKKSNEELKELVLELKEEKELK